jgi:3-oxoacyl-[acyl-carrier protein] reductase
MLLAHKVAMNYGAGGPIGGAVAAAFAQEGARVYLAGRTAPPLDRVATAMRKRRPGRHGDRGCSR